MKHVTIENINLNNKSAVLEIKINFNVLHFVLKNAIKNISCYEYWNMLIYKV